MVQELTGNRGNTKITAFPPSSHLLANGIDHLQGDELLLEHRDLWPPGAGFEIVARGTAALGAHRLPLFILPVTSGFFKGGIEDGVIYKERHSS